jgi:deazaflavin-dependent oxidoreductase (nitroreductase family)
VARVYRPTRATRAFNGFTLWLARRGWGTQVALTTTGRTTGLARTVPVTPLDIEGTGYLVSPYGQVAWVKNVRANPRVKLRHGRQTREVRLMELKPEQAARLLHEYWKSEKYARPYFDVGSSPTSGDFRAEASSHPVFRIIT